MSRSIHVTLDPVKFTRKPTDSEAGQVTKRLKKEQFDSTKAYLEQIIIPNGRTHTPGVYTKNGVRKNQFWVGQDIFALDFDDTITFEAFMDRCDKYQLPPVFVYESFSSINKNKFRAAWCSPQYIESLQVSDYIQKALLKIFPEADQKCKDKARMFFGGKNVIYENHDQYLDIEALNMAAVDCIRNADPVNYARNIISFAQSCGVLLRNNIPWLDKVIEDPKVEDSMDPHIDIYWISIKSSKNEGVEDIQDYCYHTSTPYWIGLHLAPVSKVKDESVSYSKVSNTNTAPIDLIKADFDYLIEESLLMSRFNKGECLRVQGELEPVLFGLITNGYRINGFEKYFFEILDKYPDVYTTSRHTIGYYRSKFYYCRNVGYVPTTITNFYPEETCDFPNLVSLAQAKQKEVRQLEHIKAITLDEGQTLLRDHFFRAMSSPDLTVHAIKAPTGIGKTELYLGLRNVVIAAPSWKVIHDISRRMTEKGYDHIIYPELPKDALEDSVAETIERLYAQGNYRLAKSYLSMYEHIDEVREYIRAEEAIREQANGQPILITHERLMYFNSPYDTIICDEDPFKTLLSLHTLRISDFGHMVTSFVTKTENKPNIKHNKVLMSVRDEIYAATEMLVHPVPDYMLDSRYMEKLAMHVGSTLRTVDTNVLGFFNAKYFYKYDDSVTYLHKRSLPEGKKIIILSATVNEKIYRRLIPDIVYSDIGVVETMGTLIQVVDSGMSRTQLRNNPEKFIDRVYHLVGENKNLITYKDKEQLFPFLNKIAHFHNATGIDTAAGQDLAVVGTPHFDSSVYVLYAKALDIDITNRTYTYDRIEYNKYSFFFSTYTENEALREVQLYLIESELVQAVGRARLLRYGATVYVFSNFPLTNAKFVNGKREVRKQKNSPTHTAVSPLTI